MRLSLFSKLLLLGVGGGVAGYLYRQRRPDVIPDSMDLDPADPVLDLDGDPLAELDEQTLLDESALELETPLQTMLEAIEQVAHDIGELYGSSHTPAAIYRSFLDDRAASGDGQTWLEALETSATENGAEPEYGLDELGDDDEINDEINIALPSSDMLDTPVADLGSGGPAGI